MPEDDKVRRLLMGIQTPSLQTAVLFVRSSPALRNNFDSAVDSITTVVENIKDAKVIGRKRDSSGNPIWVSHSNPLQDTRVYEVAFPDGTMTEYSANLIATAMFAQVDDDGRSYNIIDKIVDHRKTTKAISEEEAYIVIRGKKHPVRTTKGWEMCVLWKNGDTSWEKLKDMKEANPIESAEYAVSKSISNEPAFNWWAAHTLKKRDTIISAV
jgi:hypothetical protein